MEVGSMKISRALYMIFAWLFVIGVLAQVFLAGMVVVARQMNWEGHIGFGHMLAAPLLLMLITAYTGKLPGRMKRLTWLLFGVYVLQADVVIFMRDSLPVASALHPVLALVDFALGVYLARMATALRTESAEEAVAEQLSRTQVTG
jgi:hypothetical protein